MKASVFSPLVFVVLCGAIFLFCLGRGIWLTLVAHVGPVIVCDEPSFDFGNGNIGETVAHTFYLRNRGYAPVHISHVIPDCGCAVAKLAKKEIPVGESLPLNAKLLLARRHGHQHIRILVESNDPKNRHLMLVIHGNAVSQIETEPTEVSFGDIPQGTPANQVVDLRFGTPMKIERVASDSVHVSATLETVAEGASYRLHVQTKEQMPVGEHNSTVFILTDSKLEREIAIPVSAVVLESAKSTVDSTPLAQ